MSSISLYLLVPAAAWLIAQAAKVAVEFAKNGRITRTGLFSSGNMPSAHSATIIGLLTVVGVEDGVHSAVFGVAAVMTAIVLYDALNVRRAVGEQGRVLRTLMQGKNQSFFTADGHRLSEVIVGSLIGLFVAVGLLQIL